MGQSSIIQPRQQVLAAQRAPEPSGPGSGVFEVALALAGTVSAGAYTAGVLDFLRLALDSWEEAKAKGEPVPTHRVLLKGITGASGGSISGTVFTAGLAKAAQEPTALHQAWVELIDFNRILQVPAQPENPLTSLLESAELDRIGQSVLETLKTRPDVPWPRWAGDPLTLRLTLGNLTGLPYWLPMAGAASGTEGYRMVLHADYAGYGVSALGADPLPGDAPLAAFGAGGGTVATWTVAVTSAIASGAFPMAFRSRVQDFPKALRDARPFISPKDPQHFVVVQPSWPPDMGGTYRSYNCDGGIINNEPVDLAREILAGPGASNERDRTKAQRLVVLVGPLVHTSTWAPAPIDAVWQEVAPLLTAWKEQARFKASDLVLAALDDVASRWLIAPKSPSGGLPPGFTPPTPIISAGLGAFGAFLHRDFRQYDYDLGRYNCQGFLRNWFKLPATNPGFGSSAPGADLPIIPLVGAAAVPLAPPSYPAQGTYTDQDLATFRGNLRQRLDYVKDRLAETFAAHWYQRWAITGAWKLWGREKIMDTVTEAVKAFLAAYRL